MTDKKQDKKREVGTSSQEGLGISGFTLSILSIVFAGVLGIIGLIFCHVQQKKYPIKLARLGILLNIIGILISTIFFYFYIQEVIIPTIQQLKSNI